MTAVRQPAPTTPSLGERLLEVLRPGLQDGESAAGRGYVAGLLAVAEIVGDDGKTYYTIIRHPDGLPLAREIGLSHILNRKAQARLR